MQGSNTDAVVVYATYPNEAEALSAAEALVGQGLIACANVSAPMTSVFTWEGRLCRESEVAMIMKTRRELAADVIELVKRLHSYQTPAVVVLPIEAGSAEFLGWIGAQTSRFGMGGA